MGYSPWGRIESDTTERLHFLSLSTILLLGINPSELKAGTQTSPGSSLQAAAGRVWPRLASVPLPGSNLAVT